MQVIWYFALFGLIMSRTSKATLHCDPDNGLYDVAWNGRCQLGLTLDAKTECCVNNYSKKQIPQSDRHVCKKNSNQFHLLNGKCEPGTTYDSNLRCCIGCPVCRPGYYKLSTCYGGCYQCENNHYSSTNDSSICLPCRQCSLLSREELEPCTPQSQAICGACNVGYQESTQGQCVKVQQRTTPAGCNADKGQYAVSHDGFCRAHTEYDPDLDCCIQCRRCPAGFINANPCYKECISCKEGTYKTYPHFQTCHPCTNCTKLHRETDKVCTTQRNSQCGDCVLGFFASEGKCINGDLDKVTLSLQDQLGVSLGSLKYSVISSIIVTVLLYVALLIGLIYIICNCCKRRSPTKDPVYKKGSPA